MPESRKRYVTLGCDLSFYEQGLPDQLARDFLGLGNYSELDGPLYLRQDDIWCAVNAVALHHLGFELTKPVEFFLERGFDVAVDYFCGEWSKHDEDAWVLLDKATKRDNLVWVSAFSRGLFLGLLCERWADVARICSWVEADLGPEYLGDAFDKELVHFYRSIAAGLRPEPMPGLRDVEGEILNCRLQRARTLFLAWQAALAGDQPAFDEAFISSLEHFGRYFDPKHGDHYDYGMPFKWIAPHHSVLAMAASRQGMRLPRLNERQAAWVVTRQSLGLPSRETI